VDTGFEEWARARTPALLRAAYLLAGGQQNAEDLTQGVLVKLAAAWWRVDDPDAYARRVLHRLQVSRWRRRSLTEMLVDAIPERGRPDPTGDVDVRIVLADALRRLTVPQRSVLVLRYYEDLSEAETAVVLGCSVGTVKSQTHKALAALRRVAPELADLGGRLPTDA
jgi:RNA polymerase sigma-70 factor (sigma-E family)